MKAIILAGGESTRFGSPKAFAEINNEKFFKKIYQTLMTTNMFNEIIISTNDTLAPHFDGYHVIKDVPQHKNKGPLSGLYSVMSQTDDDLYFVVSVDTPMVTDKAISQLYQFLIANLIEAQLVVAGFQVKGRPIPTIAFYHKTILPHIEAALNGNDYSMRRVYERVSTDWLDVTAIQGPSYWYRNINYQEELLALKTEMNR
ncbi:molybdenum cofactor guanylyltransferase MobA [Staphylococcus hyicus]|uniref:Molybdenum cofactor guanylyltransferase MobA n=2 Tax=Staphylococcus hyicus TaxID=1284 RepID=A0ACD5FP58_STAHY|nr:molybdenum cofactor guanylyltransferase MobA [Staphylococcus hyicus]MCE5153969.1 molybdenum cofactor guanylyltransferase MobA [Staphylococcus hyicus]MCO4328770.1 molybdenum cofactor guanylyltransferase MobA [Staphylococcus hyicus]MCO4331096.1 molybdenum cofactor guanylyltransferase MobA [Staphylococcus hyicus]MCO4333393.1 molybdenum cofactor guanylyltransferase MobA [Staphylococcus hyicus]MCO4336832.1 molybdenum cofactor guanylyltransferase MobA [Staphylococcus hyicus]